MNPEPTSQWSAVLNTRPSPKLYCTNTFYKYLPDSPVTIRQFRFHNKTQFRSFRSNRDKFHFCTDGTTFSTLSTFSTLPTLPTFDALRRLFVNQCVDGMKWAIDRFIGIYYCTHWRLEVTGIEPIIRWEKGWSSPHHAPRVWQPHASRA